MQIAMISLDIFFYTPRTLFTWYKDVIIDYHKDKQEGNFASHKVVEINDTTGEVVKEKVVHILNPYHIGHSMCIDEKMINGHYCTILSNQETGKIAMLIADVPLLKCVKKIHNCFIIK